MQFVQTCLDCISVKLHEVIPVSAVERETEFFFQNPFPSAAKLLPHSLLKAILNEYLSKYPVSSVIYTDASQKDEKAGISSFSQSLD